MKLVDQLTLRLLEVFKETVPPPSRRKPLRAEEAEKSLGRFYEMARQLRREHRPGVLARARIALRLQQALNAAGYPPQMTRQVLFSLIVSAFVGKV